MNKTFYINGGAGRVISAIPALEKFHYLNPNNDFKVLVAGWESLYYSHPLLQNRTFSINQKGEIRPFGKRMTFGLSIKGKLSRLFVAFGRNFMDPLIKGCIYAQG